MTESGQPFRRRPAVENRVGALFQAVGRGFFRQSSTALTTDAIAAKELTLRAGKKNFRKLVLG